MKSIFPMLLCASMLSSGIAQETDDEAALALKVENAIHEFKRENGSDKELVKEVVVVVPPRDSIPGETSDAPASAIQVPDTTPDEIQPANAKPRLVTGKPPTQDPQGGHQEKSSDTPRNTETTAPDPPIEATPNEEEGLGIRIESLRDGNGSGASGEIKLKASFSAKALSATPEGWTLSKTDHAPAFVEKVTLRADKTVSLNIIPHVLTPATDGENTFAVVEPGFDPTEGYRQSNTVSAILGNSVVQLDRDALLLGNAISDLHQLLSSLPKPESEPDKTTKKP